MENNNNNNNEHRPQSHRGSKRYNIHHHFSTQPSNSNPIKDFTSNRNNNNNNLDGYSNIFAEDPIFAHLGTFESRYTSEEVQNDPLRRLYQFSDVDQTRNVVSSPDFYPDNEDFSKISVTITKKTDTSNSISNINNNIAVYRHSGDEQEPSQLPFHVRELMRSSSKPSVVVRVPKDHNSTVNNNYNNSDYFDLKPLTVEAIGAKAEPKPDITPPSSSSNKSSCPHTSRGGSDLSNSNNKAEIGPASLPNDIFTVPSSPTLASFFVTSVPSANTSPLMATTSASSSSPSTSMLSASLTIPTTSEIPPLSLAPVASHAPAATVTSPRNPLSSPPQQQQQEKNEVDLGLLSQTEDDIRKCIAVDHTPNQSRLLDLFEAINPITETKKELDLLDLKEPEYFAPLEQQQQQQQETRELRRRSRSLHLRSPAVVADPVLNQAPTSASAPPSPNATTTGRDLDLSVVIDRVLESKDGKQQVPLIPPLSLAIDAQLEDREFTLHFEPHKLTFNISTISGTGNGGNDNNNNNNNAPTSPTSSASLMEPLFCGMALFDLNTRTRLTEMFYFDMNSREVCDKFGLKFSRCNDALLHMNHPQSFTRAAATNPDGPKPDVYLVMQIYKVFQRDIREHMAIYLRNDKNKIKHMYNEIQDTISRHGADARQPFAYSFISVNEYFTKSTGSSAHNVPLTATAPGNIRSQQRPEQRIFHIDKFYYMKKSYDAGRLLDRIVKTVTENKVHKKTIYGAFVFSMTKTVLEGGEKNSNGGASFDASNPMQQLESHRSPANEQSSLSMSTRYIESFPIPSSPVLVNNLYVYPAKFHFSGKLWDQKSVLLTVRFLENDDCLPVGAGAETSSSMECFFSKQSAPVLTRKYVSTVTFHDKEPSFFEEIKCVLPLTGFTEKHHLFFTFEHVSSSRRNDRELIGYSILKLLDSRDGSLKVHSGYNNIPVWNDLPSKYYLKVIDQVSEQGDDSSAYRRIDGGRATFSFHTYFASSFYPDEDNIYQFFQSLNEYHNQQKAKMLDVDDFVMRIRNLAHMDERYLCQYAPLIFDMLLALIRDSVAGLQKQRKQGVLSPTSVHLGDIYDVHNKKSYNAIRTAALEALMMLAKRANGSEGNASKSGENLLDSYIHSQLQFSDIHEPLASTWLYLLHKVEKASLSSEDSLPSTSPPQQQQPQAAQQALQPAAVPGLTVSGPERTASTTKESSMPKRMSLFISRSPRVPFARKKTTNSISMVNISRDDTSPTEEISIKTKVHNNPKPAAKRAPPSEVVYSNQTHALFAMITKSMVLALKSSHSSIGAVTGNNRMNWFPRGFLSTLEQIVEQMARFIVLNSTTKRALVTSLNLEVSVFIKFLFRIADRGFVLRLAYKYIMLIFSMSSDESGLITLYNTWAYTFLTIIMKYKHLVSLTLPTEYSVESFLNESTNMSSAAMIAMFREQLQKKSYFNSIIIKVFKYGIRQMDDNVRRMSILAVRDLLLKESRDPRYQGNRDLAVQMRQRFADLNFGIVLAILESFDVWREVSEKKRALLTENINKKRLLLDKIDGQITAALEANKAIDEEIAALKNMGVLEEKKAMAEKSAQKALSDQNLKNLIDDKVARRRAVVAAEQKIKEETVRLNSERAQLMLCVGHILTNMSRDKLRDWWQNEAPFLRSTFLRMLLMMLETCACSQKDVLSQEQVNKALILHSRNQNSSDETYLSLVQANLASETAFIVLDILLQFILDNENELSDPQLGLMDVMFELFTRGFLGSAADSPVNNLNSSNLNSITLSASSIGGRSGSGSNVRTTAILPAPALRCFLVFFIWFMNRYAENLLFGTAQWVKRSELLCEEILKLCIYKDHSVRSTATAVLYLYMRKHYEYNRALARLKINLTVAVSRLIPDIEDQTQLKKSIAEIAEYAAKDTFNFDRPSDLFQDMTHKLPVLSLIANHSHHTQRSPVKGENEVYSPRVKPSAMDRDNSPLRKRGGSSSSDSGIDGNNNKSNSGTKPSGSPSVAKLTGFRGALEFFKTKERSASISSSSSLEKARFGAAPKQQQKSVEASNQQNQVSPTNRSLTPAKDTEPSISTPSLNTSRVPLLNLSLLSNTPSSSLAEHNHDEDFRSMAYFKDNVKDLCAQFGNLLSDIFLVRRYEANHVDGETITDLYYRISCRYVVIPELRVVWLDRLADYHIQLLNFAEAAQSVANIIILVADYLRGVGDGFVSKYCTLYQLQKICPAMKTETAIHEDIRQALAENHFSSFSKTFTLEHLVQLLEKVSVLFEKALQYEYSCEVHKILIAYYERQRQWTNLSRTHFHLHELYDLLADESTINNRVFGTYYKVNFYGAKFGEDLNNKAFIYKTPKITMLNEIMLMLETSFRRRFPNVQIINSTADVSRLLSENADGCFIQITNVKPYLGPIPDGLNVVEDEEEERVTNFERCTNLRAFIYETPFTMNTNKSQGDVKDQWKKKTIVVVENPFPWVKKRALIVASHETVLEPIKNAIELLAQKNERLYDELRNSRPQLNQLSLTLQGSVRVTVNAGSQELAKAFLANPEEFDIEDIIELYETCKEFLALCGELLSLHGSLVNTTKQMAFHESLVEGYHMLCDFYEPYFARVEDYIAQKAETEEEAEMEDEATAVLHPQRHAKTRSSINSTSSIGSISSDSSTNSTTTIPVLKLDRAPMTTTPPASTSSSLMGSGGGLSSSRVSISNSDLNVFSRSPTATPRLSPINNSNNNNGLSTTLSIPAHSLPPVRPSSTQGNNNNSMAAPKAKSLK